METNAALQFVRENGPIQPVQLAKRINTNILFASAILSELSDKGKIKISYVKKGGSPFYYVEGQEEKLMNLAVHLSPKVKEAYDILSQQLVVRDSEAQPWMRVALRDLKDYAISLSVNYNDNHETFWKWYLVSNDEAKDLIKKILNKKDEIIEPIKEEVKPLQEAKEIVDEKKELPVQEKLIEPIKEEVKPLQEAKEKVVSQVSGDYISEYFKSREMYIISQIIVKKGKENNFIVDVPSTLGKLRYFVKYKSKKSISDKDLLDALKEATAKNLPLLYLSDGDLSSKAQKYLENNISGQLVFRKL